MQKIDIQITVPRENLEDSAMQTTENVSVLASGNTTNPKKALILIHGRFASAENITSLTRELSLPDDVVVFAPEAKTGEWYPQRFLVDREKNQPFLDIALSTVDEIIKHALEKFHLAPQTITLAGFSQGACLVADYAARNPQKYGGVVIFSGGLIGSDNEVERQNWQGSLESTPIYIGCDENDSHIPVSRVNATARILQQLNGAVTEKIYSGLGHSIHPEGIEFIDNLLNKNSAN